MKKGIGFLIAGFLLLILSVGEKWIIDGDAQFKNQAKKLEHRLNKAEENILSQAAAFREIQNINFVYFKEVTAKFNESSILFKNSEKLYWTTREVPDVNVLSRIPVDSTLILNFGSRFYQITTVSLPDDLKLIGFVPVYNEEQNNNALIEQGFPLLKRLEGTFSLNKIPATNNIVINSLTNNSTLGYLQPVGTNAKIPLMVTWLSGMILLLIGISYLMSIEAFEQFKIPAIFIFALLLYLWRYMFLNKNLGILEQWDVFSPDIYANKILSPSLGALLITVGLALILVRAWYRKPIISQYNWFTRIFGKHAIVFSYLTGLIMFGWFTTLVLKSILLDSNLRLSVEQMQEMDMYSVLGIICIMLAILVFFYYSYRIVRHIQKQKLSWLTIIVFWAIITVATYFILTTLGREFELFLPVWILAHTLLMLYFLRKEEYLNNFLQIMSLVALFSIYASYYHGLHEKQNLLQSVTEIADNLYDQTDPLASYLLQNAAQEIQQDHRIVNDMRNPFIGENTTLNRIKGRYLNRYLKNYTKELTFIKAQDSLSLGPIIEPDYSVPDMISYRVKIPIIDKDNAVIKVLSIVLTDSKLTVDSRFQRAMRGVGQDFRTVLPKDLSYTMFKEGQPYYTKGISPVLSYDAAIAETLVKNVIATKTEGNQLKYYFTPEDGELLVMSLNKGRQLSGYLSLFSYNFSLLMLTLLIAVFILTFFFTNPGPFFTDSLLNRLQYIVLLMLFIVVGLIGALTFYNFKQDAKQRLKEDNRDALRSLIFNYEKENGRTFSEEKFIDFISRWASLEQDQIQYFDANGELLFGNDLTFFEDGVWSKMIDPIAYFNIKELNKVSFEQEESIGLYNYTGSYVAIKSGNAELQGVLYTPMFDIVDDVVRELKPIYVMLLNIFTFIMLLATLAALFITNSFSGFLNRLRRTVTETTLGGDQKPLEWKYPDEIGELVGEYNNMVEKLEESAVLLARSERESAWRDMAKQVAHEIKNPLTPMKLSIQQLKRSLKDGELHGSEQRDRTLETLVSQIDHLSVIVSEFSSIAKMPLPVNQDLDLKLAVIEALELFDNNPNYILNFINNVEEEAIIYADPTMVNRVLNNVLQNASQALTAYRDGIINVIFSTTKTGYKIDIVDNGKGIALKDQARIFTPNFTTKSAGSGLGLMMSKKIMELEKGDISFSSQVDQGTTFSIYFPTKYYFKNEAN